MNDCIEILNSNNKRNVEIVCIYKLKDYDKEYIIYKEVDSNDDFYIAHLENNNNEYTLNTEISETELEEGYKILNNIINES